ncbi:aminopeptidase P family protein [Candidatus Parabeggiatoa sp. HSG14]|uniref:aminopeptidase P family protein n=1 Tax=Candidatus Parabeggiatoa sp. HSG14 TaxID=3055593 RepID=UPI0025A6DBD5|nr:aminopeptidase P family protein [Thiotrichales bacterium HSG14]
MKEKQVASNKAESAKRLQVLWTELEKRGLDGFLVPHADEYQGEYVPPSAQRLEWLTGFTGSAGMAIVHRKGSAIFVDGRYTLAVRDQVDQNLFQPHSLKDCSPEKWLSHQPTTKLGYDPWLHTPNGLASLQRACEKIGGELIPCDTNPIDTIWTDRPEQPLAAVVPYSISYAGESGQTKCERIGATLAENRVDAAVLTAPDSIAWLLNIRGGDVPRTPLPLCFAIIYVNGQVDLFMDSRKQGPELLEHLGDIVTCHAPQQLGAMLDKLGHAKKSVQVDAGRAAIWIFKRLEAASAKIIKDTDPCVLPKACKNTVEIAGIRTAHHKDGVALTHFLHWLDKYAITNSIDEIQAAERLAQFRAETGFLQDLSFDTISAAGTNAAIVHYQVTPQTNKTLPQNSLYLVDSGGQYLNGTTDVTRTIAVGTPTSEHKDRFTRVLKGHIRIATCRFPEKTSGSQLDVLARHALWQIGLDFDHGVGHGVGCFLSVHEGPQSISKTPNKVVLKPGMILSNEPGYYKTDAFGIRIENLIIVTEPQAIDGGEQPMLGFDTLTLAPIDINLIEPQLLNEEEIAWLNTYHKRVFEKIGPALENDALIWLKQATRAI